MKDRENGKKKGRVIHAKTEVSEEKQERNSEKKKKRGKEKKKARTETR